VKSLADAGVQAGESAEEIGTKIKTALAHSLNDGNITMEAF
jgi:hypothetical protein